MRDKKEYQAKKNKIEKKTINARYGAQPQPRGNGNCYFSSR